MSLVEEVQYFLNEQDDDAAILHLAEAVEKLNQSLAEVSRIAHSADAMWRPIGGGPNPL